jgi:hypothetical protein
VKKKRSQLAVENQKEEEAIDLANLFHRQLPDNIGYDEEIGFGSTFPSFLLSTRGASHQSN